MRKNMKRAKFLVLLPACLLAGACEIGRASCRERV